MFNECATPCIAAHCPIPAAPGSPRASYSVKRADWKGGHDVGRVREVKADNCTAPAHVRFTPKSGDQELSFKCRLITAVLLTICSKLKRPQRRNSRENAFYFFDFPAC